MDLRHDLRTARKASGLTFAEFAQAAGFSEAHLRSVENGNRGLNSAVARAYDRVLSTGGQFSAAIDGQAGRGASWNRGETQAALTELANGGGVQDRRGFLGTAAGSAALALVGHWQTALKSPEPLESPGRAIGDPRIFDRIDDRLDDLRHLDDEIGSGDMARLARNELALLAGLIKRGGMTDAATARAYALASEASRQVAWNLFDSGRHQAAHRYFEGALRASATASDANAGAYAASFMAIQHYSVGDPRTAVKLIDSARDELRSSATPRMRAMLAARYARALSKTGDLRGCARALNEARDLLDAGTRDGDPAYLYWVNIGEVEMIAGSSALELGDPTWAIHCFNTAMQAEYPGDTDYPRTHAIYLARLAEAHLELRDLEAAAVHANHAAACLQQVESARSSGILSGLRSKLAPFRANSPAVSEFLAA